MLGVVNELATDAKCFIRIGEFMAFHQGGPVGVRLSYLAASAILVIFIVSVGANVASVNAGRPHPLQTVGPGICVGNEKSIQEWCPDHKTWKSALVCHNGQMVPETQDCPTETQTATYRECSESDAPKDVSYCYPYGAGTWKSRKVCRNGVWQQETQTCPECDKGTIEYGANCPSVMGGAPDRWMSRRICENGHWRYEEQSCPECTTPGFKKCVNHCENLLQSEKCRDGWECQKNGKWEWVQFNACFICYIATATYGSELSPEVQLLRNFRDRDVLQTFAGSNFMRVFNMVYYSFSPQVAGTISVNENLRTMMRYVLYPLIGILWATQQIYSAFAFSPEGAVVIAGLFAGSLIGLVYASPVILVISFAIARAFRRRLTRVHVYMSLPFLAIATSLIIVSELTRFAMLMQVSTSLLMLTTWALPGIALSAWALNRHR